MITVQAAAYCEELIKLAQGDQEVQRVVETEAGMPFPSRPGPIYMRRFFGDALAAGLGGTVGFGATQLALRALKSKPGGLKIHEKIRGPLRILGPMVAGGSAVAFSNLANELRKQRLAEAIVKDQQNVLKKQQEKK